MKLSNHYQNAYVTHDIEKAISMLEIKYGFEGISPGEIELDVVTPSGNRKLHMQLAFCWIDSMQFELIQPISGCVEHYLSSLPSDETDFSLRFNHVAMRRDDMDAMRNEIKELDLPVLFEGNLNGLCFIYVDARKSLGHILEYVCTTPEIWNLLGWPAGKQI
ncbi:hypothetical protein FT643_05425 [Ketobacter sp. MCCC 1A13808]|uniref:VOC family protein n=1 Tax=Ketobacter sp. MCCC 1A13808 TaxID=2602738 RepID=UPI000F1FF1CB|nr:VOC family protein [Ketobacter sp. MCCC 1A13808]MVF11581.1 hypothetical protein [Ketobacter sp. MCCC 1A13808]RLP55195.1 MAG: hypothetical protein D6160_05425 [Ketobacter sp.]